jgi:hypothetical protein
MTAVESPEQLGRPEVAQRRQATVEIVMVQVIVRVTTVEMVTMVSVG